ncbi:MAG: ABC-2 transporter permease [Oscillospiraceae bacterium]|nr:ABC-2 transporter permease [Oscillospiraceae bacterium]
MNGVKGLILKEIYLRRKTLLSGLSIFVLLFILAVSFCLSFDYGNMKNNEELNRDSTIILAYAMAGVGIMLFSQNGETFVKDRKCKWNIFEYTLPLSPQKLAAVKTGLLWGSNLLGTAVSTAFAAVIFAFAHHQFTLAAMANITVIALAAFAFMTFMDFLLLKFQDPQKAALVFSGVIIALYVLFMVWVWQRQAELEAFMDSIEASDTSESLDMAAIEELIAPALEWRDRLFPFSILFFAAVAVIGYFLFLTQYKRREK